PARASGPARGGAYEIFDLFCVRPRFYPVRSISFRARVGCCLFVELGRSLRSGRKRHNSPWESIWVGGKRYGGTMSLGEGFSGARFNQPVVDGVKGQLKPVRDAEFVKDIVQMVFHRLLADEELFANLAVAEALSDMLHNLFLAVAEQRLVAFHALLGGLGKGATELRHHAL